MTLALETFSFQAVTDVSVPRLTRPVLHHTIFHFLNTLSETEFQKIKGCYTTLPLSPTTPPCSVPSPPSTLGGNCLNAWFSVPSDVLRFDNTYSFIHAKKVSFTVEVLLPDKAAEEKMNQQGADTPK